MDQSDLIKKLASSHDEKPFWKERKTFLGLWFGGTILYYLLIISLFSKLDPKSSVVFLILLVSSSLAGWLYFTTQLNSPDDSKKLISIGAASVVGLLVTAFFHDEFIAQNVLHNRSASLTSGDLNCFSHTVLSALVPLTISVMMIKNFFVGNKFWALLFLSFHVTAMSVLWTEMSCPDRELWHLLLGHQTSIVGVFLLAIFSGYLIRKRVS